MLNEFVYCKRLFYLEWINGEFEESPDTIEGDIVHRNVDVEPSKDTAPNYGVGKFKSITLSSTKLGIISKIDMVEYDGGAVTPVEYKKGAASKVGAWDNDRVQVCAQALILRDNGFVCDRGEIYYDSSKKRISVDIDEPLIKETVSAVKGARMLLKRTSAPAPLVDSSKCFKCSLAGICLPDEVTSLSGKGRAKQDVRRLFPINDDRLPVYMQDQGLYITKAGENLTVSKGGKPVKRILLMETSSVSIFGNIQISTQAIRELCRRGITVSYFTYGGWFYGITTGTESKNIELRRVQFKVAGEPAESLKIARRFIHGKIVNDRTLLRRNNPSVTADALRMLNDLGKRSLKAKSLNELLGIEGEAGRIYFSNFSGMLKAREEFDFNSRNRRPPTDPVNALLSFAYALLVNLEVVTLLRVGFDPYMGFLHQSKYGKPALALDLMEEFRPLIADSAVIELINNGIVKRTDFIIRSGSCALLPDARKSTIDAFERRLETPIIHPVFGYRVIYRRIIEIQARLLARYIMGEIREYPEFRTR